MNRVPGTTRNIRRQEQASYWQASFPGTPCRSWPVLFSCPPSALGPCPTTRAVTVPLDLSADSFFVEGPGNE